MVGAPATPGRRSSGAVSRKGLRPCPCSQDASSVRYQGSPRWRPGPRWQSPGSIPSVIGARARSNPFGRADRRLRMRPNWRQSAGAANVQPCRPTRREPPCLRMQRPSASVCIVIPPALSRASHVYSGLVNRTRRFIRSRLPLRGGQAKRPGSAAGLWRSTRSRLIVYSDFGEV